MDALCPVSGIDGATSVRLGLARGPHLGAGQEWYGTRLVSVILCMCSQAYSASACEWRIRYKYGVLS